jgi:hexosaminidase
MPNRLPRRWSSRGCALAGAVLALALSGATMMVAPPGAAAAAVKAEEVLPVSIIPAPARLTARPGAFLLTAATRIQAPAALRPIAERFRDDLRPATGLPLPIAAAASGPRIALALDKRLGALGAEGYRLTVTPRRVEVRAFAPAGIFYGLQSFRQLLPASVFRKAAAPAESWRAPCLEIEDRPRFSWRGSHLDVGRHFMPKEALLKHIELMALHKLNVFHWHLTEDQGWRIEIKKYPKLTEVGAYRRDSPVGPAPRDKDGKRAWVYQGKAHGGFYTQDDVREVVRFAADRFVTVVPEIEMPGHARAAIAAYPELGNTGKTVEVATTWGVFNEVFNTEDRTLAFLQDVLTEVLALFPSKFIHLGGDECVKTEWKASPGAQARIKALGLADENQLQSWFVHQMDTWLTARGRRLVGWDEILEGGLAPGATVMSWRGEAGGIQAARAGHDVVMTPEQPTYFDHAQSKDAKEPASIGGHNPIESVYAYEPVPAQLTPQEAEHVLGAQAQLWTEYMGSPRHVEYMAWPRLCAMAEVLWSPRELRELAGFKQRLRDHLARLQALDVNFRPLDGPLPAALTIP